MTVSGLITTSMKNMNMNGDAAADMHAVVESFIIGVVKDLVCMSEKDDGGAEQLSWHGTKSDLLELLRVAYDSGEVMTADGVQMAFSEIVKAIAQGKTTTATHCRSSRPSVGSRNGSISTSAFRRRPPSKVTPARATTAKNTARRRLRPGQ